MSVNALFAALHGVSSLANEAASRPLKRPVRSQSTGLPVTALRKYWRNCPWDWCPRPAPLPPPGKLDTVGAVFEHNQD